MMGKINKGRGITGAIDYCKGEGRDKATNERKTLEAGQVSRAEVLGCQNFGFEIESDDDLDLARRIMEWQAKPENQASSTRKCEMDCLHLTLSWHPGYEPSKSEMNEAARGALKDLGMENARAVFFSHSDTDISHVHVVASRIDPETGRTYSDTLDHVRLKAWELKWEREHGQVTEARRDMHALANAAIRRDGAAVVDHLTERSPTFTATELKHAFMYGGLDEGEVKDLTGKALAGKNIIGLREAADKPVTRYTTREILQSERDIQNEARALKGDRTHGLGMAHIDGMAAKHKLTDEQAAALKHCTRPEGFAMLYGEAGTGKSTTLGAIREAYEAKGFEVVGLSSDNSVVTDMRRDGFRRANTVASELGLYGDAPKDRLGSNDWNPKTVVMVDEAAKLSTSALAAVTARARESGAKVILAGDPAQLPSIERGGMFAPLMWEHGAAELRDVMRVKDPEQKKAFNHMNKGQFAPAMEIFEKQGALNFTDTQDQAAFALAARYRADVAANPDKTRFIFAATNEQVGMLNRMARDLAREQGQLGEDHALKTDKGEKVFAVGDRIQLTGNGQTKYAKGIGFTKGTTGTISGIEVEKDGRTRVAVAIDAKPGKQPREISFVVGDNKERGEWNEFTHGYAGTIYKGQGKTLDQSYVLVSQHWKAASSYVALSRHRERANIFAPRDVATDKDGLAKLMGRRDERSRAASSYSIDPETAGRSGLRMADVPRRRSETMAAVEKGAGVVLAAVADRVEATLNYVADIFSPSSEPPKKPTSKHEQAYRKLRESFPEADPDRQHEQDDDLDQGWDRGK